jgi:hypothetical protein
LCTSTSCGCCFPSSPAMSISLPLSRARFASRPEPRVTPACSRPFSTDDRAREGPLLHF